MRKIAEYRVRDAAVVVAAVWILAVTIAVDARFGNEAVSKIASGSMHDHYDFETFWYSARALWDGRNIYDTGHPAVSSNAPILTMLISPFGLLEPLTAYRIFVPTMLLMTVGYLAWMADELRLRTGWAVVGVGMLLFSMPLLTTLVLGQIYLILALGLVTAWVTHRRGNTIVAGAALGIVVTIKPSLAPLILLPLVRRQWEMLGASISSGAASLLVGILTAGPTATLDWLRFVANRGIDEVWTNASLPAHASRLFTENELGQHIAVLPWMVPFTLVVAAGLVILTAWRARLDPEMGFWALVAASLLASPVSWHGYMVLLGPGILLLTRRGRWPLALLLLALQLLPNEWGLLWRDAAPVVESLALTLYCFVLIAHWLTFFLTSSGEQTLASRPAPQPGEAS